MSKKNLEDIKWNILTIVVSQHCVHTIVDTRVASIGTIGKTWLTPECINKSHLEISFESNPNGPILR